VRPVSSPLRVQRTIFLKRKHMHTHVNHDQRPVIATAQRPSPIRHQFCGTAQEGSIGLKISAHSSYVAGTEINPGRSPTAVRLSHMVLDLNMLTHITHERDLTAALTRDNLAPKVMIR
jgi:hypothetical protein